MSERKAINKWYPPDYDPSKVPKKAKTRSASASKSRLMLPFSMKCLQCNEYIAARRKFNARKEVTGEKYMGFKLIKFHIRCPRCSNNIIFRTDPALAGFVPVEGGVRNYESLAKEPKIKPMETEEEILTRLEKEEEESKKYKEQQEKRKKNPFWQSRADSNGQDAMANLEERLVKQQDEQQTHDHLMYLQAKANRLQESGGQDKLAQEAQARLAEEKSLKRELEPEDNDYQQMIDKSKLDSVEKKTATVSGVIRVKRPRRIEVKQDSEKVIAKPEGDTISPPKLPTPPPMEASNKELPGLAGYGSSDSE